MAGWPNFDLPRRQTMTATDVEPACERFYRPETGDSVALI